MERFKLEEDESLDKRCGEIFVTTKGRISFHCSLCEEAYFGFESYQAHLDEVHLSTDVKLEIEENDLVEEAMELTQNLENYLDAELNNFENELKEMLTTITEACSSVSLSMEDEFYVRRQKRRRKTMACASRQMLEKTISEASVSKGHKDCQTELTIPGEIREVVKRAVYKVKTTAEEDRKHKCPICGFGFKDRGNMLHHFRRHSNQRNYACDECDKRFYSSTELHSHKRCHTQERTLLCTECGRMFLTKSALGSHLKRHRDQRDYHCQYPGCQKAFYDSTLLKNHMLSHSSERHFACSVCNAAFKRLIALKNHMKLHENKREYKCQICETGFNQQAGLFSHIKTAHKLI